VAAAAVLHGGPRQMECMPSTRVVSSPSPRPVTANPTIGRFAQTPNRLCQLYRGPTLKLASLNMQQYIHACMQMQPGRGAMKTRTSSLLSEIYTYVQYIYVPREHTYIRRGSYVPSILEMCFLTLPAQPWQWMATFITTTYTHTHVVPRTVSNAMQ